MITSIHKIKNVLKALDESVEKRYPILKKKSLKESLSGGSTSFSVTSSECDFTISNLQKVYPQLKGDTATHDVSDIFGVFYWTLEMDIKHMGINGVTIEGKLKEVTFSLNIWGDENDTITNERIDTSEYTVDCSEVKFSDNMTLYINEIDIDAFNKTITARSRNNVYD